MKTVLPTVLIVTKDAASRGGVANYYDLFFKKYEDQEPRIERFDIGSRSKDYYRRQQRFLGYCWEYVLDLFRFMLKLITRCDIRIVQFNPSLIPVPMIRDGLLLILSRLLRRRTIVFWRGWSCDVEEAISKSSWRCRLFGVIFGQADRSIVLAEDFRDKLAQLGVAREKILVSRTMFDENMIQPRLENNDSVIRFLYLGRIHREKGCFEIVEALGKIKERGVAFEIAFYGHGATVNAVSELRSYAEISGVSDRIVWGDFVDGLAKYQAYARADVYLLPSYTEGCPNSILEAMGAGCFVISTGVGAMKEVVQNGVNGLIVRVEDAEDLADKMLWTIGNLATVRKLGRANREYAFAHFESRAIIRQILSVYKDMIAER